MPTCRTRAPVINLDEGLSAIAKAFAPPGAAETLAYAKAGSERESASRLAELYRQAGDANLDTVVFDRRAGIAGAYNPSQSMTVVNANNATSERNNAADNARALRQTGLQQQGELSRSMIAPVQAGATRFVPPSIASAFGVGPTQVGVVELNQGQQATLPDGRVLSGAEKPLSMDERKAQDYAGMPDPLRQAIVFGNTPTTNVQTPGGPRISSVPDSIGQAPAVDNSAKVTNYTGPNGAKGTAVPGAGGKLVDTQTGAEVPAGSTVYSGQAQGTPDQFGKSTEAEAKSAYAATMTEGATKDLLSAFDNAALPTAGDAALRGVSSVLPQAVSPLISNQMNEQGQVFYQNLKTALPMQLLVQSGQGVTENEYERKMQELVPVPGEAPGVTAAKRRQIAAFAAGVQGLSGNALAKARSVAPSPDPKAAPASAPAASEAWVRGPDGKLKRAQ
jgi:hypothetical protein